MRLWCAGVDNQVKVWDIRMLKPLHEYFSYSPATTLDISQRGLLAVGYGRKVQVRGHDLQSTSPVCSSCWRRCNCSHTLGVCELNMKP